MPPPPSTFATRLSRSAISLAHRAETGVRDLLARRGVRRGWTPAPLPYRGYASAGTARVLGRVVLAPADVDPAARRGIQAWRRLLTLESPGTEVEIELAGTTVTATSDAAGIVDARVPVEDDLPLGLAHARLTVGRRDPASVPVHVVTQEPVVGVVCDIDDTAWVTGLAHPVRAAWRMLSGSSSTRRSVPGMADLLREAVRDQEHTAVVYLSNGPWNLAGVVSRFLERNDFPPGAILMTDWGVLPHRWFRDGREHKRGSLARLLEDLPHVTWVLVGDDGEHDPAIYAEVARRHPDRVAAIALRRTRPAAPSRSEPAEVNGVPVIRGVDGDGLLPLLRDALAAHR